MADSIAAAAAVTAAAALSSSSSSSSLPVAHLSGPAAGSMMQMSKNSKSYCFREIVPKRSLDTSDTTLSVVIADIEPKHASSLLLRLSDELPLSRFGLDHLKRIRKLDGNKSQRLQLLLYTSDSEGVVLSEEVKSMVKMSNIQHTVAAKYVPETREEFQSWGQHWPIVFRPSELNRDRDRGLPVDEADTLGQYIDALDLVERRFSENLGISDYGSIIINPVNGKIVANSYDGWNYLSGVSSSSSSSPSSQQLTASVETASAAAVAVHSTKMNALYTPTMICIEIVAAITRADIDSPGLLEDNHYLCTGMDIFTTLEPDLMSSMGLIHSRIRRVFYRKSNEKEGSLGTLLNVHVD